MGVALSAPQYVSRRPYVSSARSQICRLCHLSDLISYLELILKFNKKSTCKCIKKKNKDKKARKKYITRDSTILERVPHKQKYIYNAKLHNISARSTRAEKYITQNSTIPERVPHAEKYNTALGPIPHHFYYFLLFETCTHNGKKTARKISYNTKIQHEK